MKSNLYPRLAFCLASTSTTEEHYQNLKKEGIETVSLCLHTSGFEYHNSANVHAYFARQAGMKVHAYMVTDLHDIKDDVIKFTENLVDLGFDSRTKITIVLNGDQYAEKREEKIIKLIDMISKYHDRSNIDLAFFKKTIDMGLYDLSKLPQKINLTIIYTDAVSPGIPEAGTWVYKLDDNPIDTIQFLAYDYRGFYTGDGYQLSLIDTEYVVQPGDSWYSIAQRHAIPLIDLLALNGADAEEAVYAGQVIKIA